MTICRVEVMGRKEMKKSDEGENKTKTVRQKKQWKYDRLHQM